MSLYGAIALSEVKAKKDLKTFIRVAEEIYAQDPCWVKPLMIERLALLDRAKNPYFDHARAAYWIAWKNGRPVGRISAQIDQLAQEHRGDTIGHFGMIEAIDDRAVFAALLGKAEDWLKAEGCTRIEGPYNLSSNGECGLLVDGFHTPPVLMMGHARPYYQKHLMALGYEKAKDLLAYELDLLKPLPPRLARFIKTVEQNEKITLREIDMRRYQDELHKIIDIYNDAWSDNWGFVPLTAEEATHLAQDIKPIVAPHRVRLCEVDGKPMGMFVTLPDVNMVLRSFNGRLFPLGWLRLLTGLFITYPKRLRVPLMGVRKIMQKSRYSAALALMMIEHTRQDVVRRGARWAELSWILEDNFGMRNILDEIGCEIYKTYRIYQKSLL
ncbi:MULTISPECIES: GNAT family N-acetyltransferase [unclassified Iodidimonas]|jgi:GNAT superfamily N-acetyltransferase|uniref:GNAT family N-acetyltransferase n=1 Tax=unclassified Iodidimonas TaxID=2626145 RepID=UPI0024830D75|nr:MULTISPECIES: GNAT family N-acetyltransferase [unclassified Iodidimonas]